ncbi:cytochrome b-c1 complex subunit 2, mitochondrial-like [Centruroides sculpturatus]|uniref:cytochrome b-c1 complex subunit 2, mitochondrial-like n=1 Tax=Centruroides sculpturatus TaxID=218467 RepID=UPI000C6CB581|nr:cytochrome b-c1 complex subunit 2, mitochondrial-like [Centruroides sculpturatus]
MTLTANLLKRSVNIAKNCKYATQAAAQTLSQPPPLLKQDPKITNLPNGKTIASIENYSPVSRITVLVKAGPRFENDDNLGISHCLRNAAGLSTKNKTVFGITRNIEYVGGRLTASADREHVIYSLDCLRDDLDKTVGFLTEVISNPAFKHWELKDYLPRMKVEVAKHVNNPETVLMESIHKAAFRGGLNNSLFCPEFKLGSHTTEMVVYYFIFF